VSPPIHLSTTFEHGPASEALHGFLYTREGNPVQSRLEQALAALEGGQAAMAFASGMAAGSAYIQSLPRESHILFH
jgi:cystathionine gamma-synthase